MKCCDLSAGMLRTRVQFQRQTRTSDGGGGFSLSWATYASTRAHVVRKGGAERATQERLSEGPMYRCVIRFRRDVAPQHRAVIDEKVYNIRSVDDIEFRKRWLDLTLEGEVPS